MLDEECLENKVEILDSSDVAVKLKQLEIQEKIELAKLQMQEQERQERLKTEQSGQITGSGTLVPDLVIFSFVLPFIVYGD